MKTLSSLMMTATLATVLPLTHAEDTNAPRTRLEAVEAATGRVIIKGTEEVGSLAGKNGLIFVKCVELRDVATNQRDFGLIITVRQNEQLDDSSTIDFDELEALVHGVDYIAKADPTISSLNHFEAAFNTRGGFRVVSYSSRRTSTTEAAVVSNRYARSRALLNLSQLTQFKVLLEQAQAKLESIRKSK